MFTILRGSCNCIHQKKEPFSLKRPNGIDCFLFLLVESSSTYIIQGVSYSVKSNSVMIIAPNVPYEAYSSVNQYHDNFIHFKCSDPAFIQKYGVLFNHPIWLRNPTHFLHYFQHVLWEHTYAPTNFKQENIDMIFQIMLNKMTLENNCQSPSRPLFLYATQLRTCRAKMSLDPTRNFSAAEHAATINISPSYFQHLYKEIFGIFFKSDLINMRLDYAINLIITTDLSLIEIMHESGFSNESYFYRHFKSKTGMTPRQYCSFMRSVTPGSLLSSHCTSDKQKYIESGENG